MRQFYIPTLPLAGLLTVSVVLNVKLHLLKCVLALVTRLTKIGNNNGQRYGFPVTKKLAFRELMKAEIVFLTHSATGRRS
jgi:hypothetical protein